MTRRTFYKLFRESTKSIKWYLFNGIIRGDLNDPEGIYCCPIVGVANLKLKPTPPFRLGDYWRAGKALDLSDSDITEIAAVADGGCPTVRRQAIKRTLLKAIGC